MGLLTNPLRSREPQLPTYRKLESPTKERFSDDEYYSSDEDSEPYSHDSSGHSSRNTSGSMSSGRLMLPKRKPAPARRPQHAYPYRLPPKVTRYLVITVVGLIGLMILSLIRASQVENWKVENGKLQNRPVAPPIWESFPFLERYYGGIRTVVPFKESRPEYPLAPNPVAFNPDLEVSDEQEQSDETVQARGMPESSSWESYKERNEESGINECFLDAAKTVRVPSIRYYNGRPLGFPQNVLGSYDIFNLPEDICLDRYGRYGPYGLGYSLRSGGLGTGEHGEKEGADAVWASTPAVDYRKVDWADVQRRCFNANADRYDALPSKTSTPHGFYINEVNSTAAEVKDVPQKPSETSVLSESDAPTSKFSQSEKPKEQAERAVEAETTAKVERTIEVDTAEVDNAEAETVEPKTAEATAKVEKKGRTAIVVRCWDEYLFREDDIANVRSIITELAMASGGRYDVHLLVQVKNDAAHPIWADHDVYQERIQEVIPEEFRGLVTLWTETQMLALYQGVFDLYTRGPELPVHGVYRGLTMAMQYFAYMHPEYEHFWQWEMDVRYTGHYYDFFSKIEEWAKAQPRKGLWERNERFYFPEVHGTWDDFSQMSRVQSEMGTTSADNIWKGAPGIEKAPEKVTKNDKTIWGPERPGDDNDWFEPGNDPVPPSSYIKDHYSWGVGEEADYISFNPMFDPEGTTWGLKDDITGFSSSRSVPRRANIITTSRMSRRLLMTMHKSTAFKKQFAFPEMWPATVALQHGYKAVYAPHPVYVDRKWPIEFMAQTFNSGHDGSSGGSRTALFGDREHHMYGLSWFYNSGFAPNMYRRWMGLKVNNDGGEEFETTQDESKQGPGVGNMPGGEGRMCLPPMLLHPVKEVELPIESPPEEAEEVVATDPTA